MSQQSNTFSDVDQASDPQHFVKCLQEQHAKYSSLRLYKARTLQKADLQAGHVVLDVGCGLGNDVVKMADIVGASGHIYGIDFSQAMIDAANANIADRDLPVTFQQGDIYALNFEDDFFDRIRADKVFQHLSDPHKAVAELVRVTKPSGKIVIADPDHDSLIIDTPFSDVNHRFVRFRSDQMAQGGIAHQLYGIFKHAGLEDVTVEPLIKAYTNYDEKKVTSPYLNEIWVAEKHGAVTKEEAEAWANFLRTAIKNDRFLCLQTYMITVGVKRLVL